MITFLTIAAADFFLVVPPLNTLKSAGDPGGAARPGIKKCAECLS